MALTPVGPCCPFRSRAANELDPTFEALRNEIGPEVGPDLARLQIEVTANGPENASPDQLRKVADGLERTISQWERTNQRMRDSPDFQVREYHALTTVHLQANHISSASQMAATLKWQATCMRAVAERQPLPMPPPEVDLEQLMELQKQAASEDPTNSSSSSMAALMNKPEPITAPPFTPEALFLKNEESAALVRDEYERLARDHQNLIDFGGKYDAFDPVGKLYFLDEMAQIHERWDIFFARFRLMGAQNPEFVRQCQQFLDHLGLTEEQYWDLLRQAHDLLRHEAEQERNRMGAAAPAA